MAKGELKQKAIELRKSEMSYSQIKKILGVSKSTLSYWLRDHPLPQERIRELRDWNERRIENYRETRRKQKEKKLLDIYNEVKKEIMPFAQRDLFIGGLLLYWGEGGKSDSSGVSISNTNPAVIKTFVAWLTKCFTVDKEKLKIRLQLYSDMDIEAKIDWWSQTLGIPRTQFRKPYIKKSKFSAVKYSNPHKNGTCNVHFYNAILGKKIHMGLKVLEDWFNSAGGA